MTRITGGPDCAVMCNLINKQTHTHTINSQGPVSVHAHCTEGVTRSEGREGTNGDGDGVGGGNGTGTGTERGRGRKQ